MLVSDILQSVRRQFGDETGAQIENADVIRWVNEGQLRISRKTEADNSTTDILFAAGTPAASLPDDFYKVSTVTYAGSEAVLKPLSVLSSSQFNTLYPTLLTDAPGAPKVCSIQGPFSDGPVIALAPKPSRDITVVLTYKSRPPLVSETTDELSISDTYYTTLITYCLAQAKQLDGDMDAFNMLMASFGRDVQEDSHDSHTPDAETYPFIRASTGDY